MDLNPVDFGLTEGALKAMLNGVQVENVIVQLLEHRLIGGNGGSAPARYRLLLNDGRNTYSFAMLATQLNPRLLNNEFPNFSVVDINKYVCNNQKGQHGVEKKVLIILALTLKFSGDQINAKIGNSTPLSESGGDSSQASNAQRPTPAPAAATGGFNNNFGGTNQSNGFGGNQGGALANGNRMQNANGNAKQSAFGGPPPAKKLNVGQNNSSSAFNQTRSNMPAQNGAPTGGAFRQQAPTFPPSVQNGGQNFGGGGGGFGGGGGGGGFGNSSFNGGGGGGGGATDQEGFGDGETPQNVFPLASLTPYQNKWTIRVRVTSKDPIRHWVNSSGKEGDVFGMWLADESEEMKCSAFNAEAVKFHAMMEVDKVYYIRGATVKAPKDAKWSRGKQYEMSMNSWTLVKECHENVKLAEIQYNFTPIGELPNVQPTAVVDVIGICISSSEVQTFNSKKTNKPFTKREIELRDRTTLVRVTLWGTTAEAFKGTVGDVVAIKGCNVSDYGGRTLSTIVGCKVEVNPNIREGHILKGWYATEGESTPIQSISMASGVGPTPLKNFLMVQEDRLGNGDKPDYFIVKATIMKVEKERSVYQACSQSKAPTGPNGKPGTCNKKLTSLGTGGYRCEACNMEMYDFQWRLMLQVELADFGGCERFVTLFQEQAESILGKTGQEVGEMKLNDMTAYDKLMSEVLFKTFLFKMRVKMEKYNDEDRLKYSVVSVEPLNFVTFTSQLVTAFNELMSS